MVHSPFDTLVPDARAFLRDLQANNTRDWFTAHKARYDHDLKQPALALLDVLAADLQKLTGTPVETKLFRPHRDVRFSKDKTPYHTYLHMLWTGGGVGWFFGISPNYITAGGGIMGFDKDALLRWRETVASDKGAEVAQVIATAQAAGMRLNDPELKRVPAPYDKEHPRGDLLRRKSLTLWVDGSKADIEKDGLTDWVMAAFSGLLPVQEMLQSLQ